MTKEYIESIRRIVLPFIAKKLKEIDYEGLGESDAKEFTKGFNEILELADKAKEQEWIHVSERLPEEFQRVLVTIVNYNGDKVVRVAEYYNRVFRIKENHEQWEVGEKGLLAWVPLPEPYKGVDEVKKT